MMRRGIREEPKALSEEAVAIALPQLELPEHHKKKLSEIVDAIFVEEFSLSLPHFFSAVEDQGGVSPELVFACADLISRASSVPPADKTLKKLGSASTVHHGDLRVAGSANIGSLLVTGNLEVAGKVQNFEGRTLFVAGNLRCEILVSEGPVIVGGDLRCTEIQASNNDYALVVHGTIFADRLVITRDKALRAGSLEVGERIDQ